MKLLCTIFLIALLFLVLPAIAFCQGITPGSLDTTFNFGKQHSYFFDVYNPVPGIGANGSVEELKSLPNGQTYIAGDFTTYNGYDCNRIARLRPDGSLDGSFDAGIGANSIIYALAVQPNGKILVGGYFTMFNSSSRSYLVRLNIDGSLDYTFQTGSGLNDGVQDIVIQSDGKILVSGEFTLCNGISRNRVVRLNQDGSMDASFNPGTGANAGVENITLLSNGKIVIGGAFTSFNSIAINRLARLNTNGTLDQTFAIGSGANALVYTTVEQPDGKLLVGGSFSTFNGQSRSSLVRLLQNGAIDTSFNLPVDYVNFIRSVTLQPDGKVIAAGYLNLNSIFIFHYYSIGRFEANGSRDTSFKVSVNPNFPILTVEVVSNGKVLIGGAFDRFNLFITRNRIALLQHNGSLDLTFNTSTGANEVVFSSLIQPDGKILLVGSFLVFNDVIVNRIVRLQPDGTIDTSFNTGTGANEGIVAVALSANGKIVVCGNFTQFNGVSRVRIARLHPDGELDTSFNPGSSSNYEINNVVIQPDEKVVVAGNFNIFAGVGRSRIARLNSNGTLDLTFNPGIGPSGSSNPFIRSIYLLSNGKLIVSGGFNQFNSIPRRLIARLNSDGSLDGSFNARLLDDFATFASVRAIQSDEKILITGNISFTNSATQHSIVRLNVNGDLDTTFYPFIPNFGSTSHLLIQADGSIFALGNFFISNNGNYSNTKFAKISSTGILDSTFVLDSSSNGYISTTAMQSDGKVLIGGTFTKYHGVIRYNVARINSLGTSVGFSNNLLPGNSVETYPSPFGDRLFISSSSGFTYRIFKIDGKLVTSGVEAGNESILSTSDWQEGMYMVHVKTKNGVEVKKIIKQ
jgi:uncharacterized delta-60 repeat protein